MWSLTSRSPKEPLLPVQRDTRPLDPVASGLVSSVSLAQNQQGNQCSSLASGWVVLGLWKGVVVQLQEEELLPVVQGLDRTPLVEVQLR